VRVSLDGDTFYVNAGAGGTYAAGTGVLATTVVGSSVTVLLTVSAVADSTGFYDFLGTAAIVVG
jgi:hypothetical protein